MDASLVDEELTSDSPPELGKILARIFFEQFPSQQSMADGAARTLLLFGAAAEWPDNFEPKAMKPDWFRNLSDGIPLEEYVESILFISSATVANNGGFSLGWLANFEEEGIKDVVPLSAVRRTFLRHLITGTSELKKRNREFQDPLPDGLKKFAFNPLADKPFIDDVADIPIAPWTQAVIAKLLPPAIYHMGLSFFGEEFTRDLGPVFQHYTGRHLALVKGSLLHPEVRYGPRRSAADSCDWFLDLPELQVLVECKARQPIESLRVGGPEWLNSVKASVGKGIQQLNRSNANIVAISQQCPAIRTKKPRVGLVVTLEPFYLQQNWAIWDHLPVADFPIGIVSMGELESLILLTATELDQALQTAARDSVANFMNLNPVLAMTSGRGNPLLEATWDSIGLFDRASAAVDLLRTKPDAHTT